ncbi:MAG TPA: hypothetical protein PLV30_03460, partial [Candidatus Marinimicrobia bacterium]|nr:hypothetical protein [Candidatus Neomarinimicrobiota bacterium]HQH55587.1 hypothetical protein [Candidatus Neomarinimicrobiota bacterium]HQK11063.1 hypothetical protein [Candidatus Neomarinimicrobiota bacterium]
MNRYLMSAYSNYMLWCFFNNKKLLSVILLLSLWLSPMLIPIEAAELSLKGNWLFQLGDDSTWSSPSLNDSNWLPIRVPDYWENQG